MSESSRAVGKKLLVNNKQEYQLETLHKYGDEHPETRLKTKVKGWHFSNTIDIIDPATGELSKKPMKPFMINQLALAIEREMLMLSPFDETLHKQLIDYSIIRISANGNPVYTNVNEHFVDCLGLCFLAFALEFPDVTKTVYKNKVETFIEKTVAKASIVKMIGNLQSAVTNITNNPWNNKNGGVNGTMTYEDTIREGDGGPKYFPTSPPRPTRSGGISFGLWGSRFSSLGKGPIKRRMW